MKNWEDCLKNFCSRKTTPDTQKAKSLIETAHERIRYTNKTLNEKTANYIFEDYYTSIIEILQAIVSSKGYNVKNHICLGYYIRDILKKENLFRIFDDLRFKRNSLIYYGKRMEFEISKDAIKKSKELLKELNSIINNNDNLR